MIYDLAAANIRDGKVPSEWERSLNICLYKGKGLHWTGATTPWSQVDRAGYENPGEDCGRPYQTGDVNRRLPPWLRPLYLGSCKENI